MAQKTIVTLVCDYCPDGENREKVGQVSFGGTDGTLYEAEACPDHQAVIEETLADFARPARKVTATQGRKGSRRAGRARSSAVRAWAGERGHTVSARGRIPAAIQAEYDAAH